MKRQGAVRGSGGSPSKAGEGAGRQGGQKPAYSTSKAALTDINIAGRGRTYAALPVTHGEVSEGGDPHGTRQLCPSTVKIN